MPIQYLFTQIEYALLLRMLLAHFISDFLLQTSKSIANKTNEPLKAKAFWWHGIITFATLELFAGPGSHTLFTLGVAITHLVIDYGKIYLNQNNNIIKWKHKTLWLFITDQLLHMLTIIIIWLFICDGWDRASTIFNQTYNNYNLILKLLGYLIVIGPITYLIKFLTMRWAKDLTSKNDSLADAGKWIGILERILVITLIFVSQFTAIGFIITAKSILRLIDKPEPPFINTGEAQTFSARKHTEYVLVGTFLSVGSAFLIGLVINWLSINFFPPFIGNN